MSNDNQLTKSGSTWNRSNTANQYVDGNGVYALGAVTSSVTSNYGNNPASAQYLQSIVTTTNSFAWHDAAVLNSTQIVTRNPSGGLISNYSTTYYRDSATGWLLSASINDSRWRTVSYINDALGQVTRRDEEDGLSSDDPHEFWIRFDGREFAHGSNNGPLELNYQASLTLRQQAPGGGPFRGGATTGTASFDTDMSFEPINSYEQGGLGGNYIIQSGDTLSSIASRMWGDASLWYKLAEANGLSTASALVEGQSLVIPSGVSKTGNSSSTFKPYDPAEAMGDTSPTTPAPAPKKNDKCGVFGAILLVAVAVAVTVLTAGAILSAAPGVTGGLSGGIGAFFGGSGAAGLSAGTVAAAGAAGAAAGSIVSQGVGLATGLQDQFSWSSVALAAISGGVAGGLAGSGLIGPVFGSPFAGSLVRGALGNALTQGVGVATGLQNQFDFSGVAASGVAAGIGGAIGGHTSLGRAGASMAGGLAGATATSLVTGRDFGDTLISQLPSIIGNTVGNLVADGIASAGRGRGGMGQTGAGDGTAAQPTTGAGGGQVGGSASGDAQPGDIVVTARRGGGYYNPVSAAVAQVVAQTVAGANGGGDAGVAASIDRGNHPYPADPEDMSGNTAWQLRAKRAAYLDAVAQSGDTFTDNGLNVKAFDDLIARADAREAPGVAAADAAVNEILRAGLVPVDIGMGGYNIATGNGGLRDYLAVGSVVPVGKVLGAVGVAARTEIKGFASYSALKRYLGSPGTGNQWHHIVEQTPGNLKAFGADVIHSTDNVVAIPASTHIGKGSISAYYSGKDFFTNGQTVRQWLSNQSLQAQRQFGLDTLKRFGQ